MNNIKGGDERMNNYNEQAELTYEQEVEMLIRKLQKTIKKAHLDIKVEVTRNSIAITNL
jgi:hypothetical protein